MLALIEIVSLALCETVCVALSLRTTAALEGAAVSSCVRRARRASADQTEGKTPQQGSDTFQCELLALVKHLSSP